MTMLMLIALLGFEGPDAVPEIDILALDQTMIDYLDEHLGHISDPYGRLRGLVRLIFDEEFLHLTYDNSQTKTAIQTFHSRNGNCLSFTTMFVAMARHLRLKVAFQEVYNIPSWEKRDNVVMLNRHINALATIGGASYVIDFNPYRDRVELRTRVVSDSRAKAQYYNNLGAELFKQRKGDLAIAYFLKAIEVYPSLSFAWSNLGAAYTMRERFMEAEDAYLTAIRLDGRAYTAMSNLAKLYARIGEENKAKRYERKVDIYRRKNPYFHLALGDEAYELGAFEEAVHHYKNALRRKADDHEIHFALARAYTRSGDLAKAEHHMGKARDLAQDALHRERYSKKLELMLSNN